MVNSNVFISCKFLLLLLFVIAIVMPIVIVIDEYVLVRWMHIQDAAFTLKCRFFSLAIVHTCACVICFQSIVNCRHVFICNLEITARLQRL